MRTWVTIFWICCILPLSAQIELIRQSYQEVTLDSILSELHIQYGLKYAYQEESIEEITTSWSYRGNNLNEALVSLFQPLELDYRIVRDDLILIRKNEAVPQPDLYEFKVKGRVVDGESGDPLPYANVNLSNGEVIFTDETGHFEHVFRHEDPSASLTAGYLSYSKAERTLQNGNNAGIELRLFPFSQFLDPVKVVRLKPVISRKRGRQDVIIMDKDFGYSFQGFSDPMASLQALPGISNFKETSGILNIRGGGDFDNFLLLDGLPLYKVDHFFGFFSAISNDVVEDITIYKNAFPAQYGGKSASVIDIRSKELKADWRGSVSLSPIYTSAAMEFPVSDKFQIFAGLRLNNINLAEDYFTSSQEENAPGRAFLQRNPNIRHSLIHEPDFSFYDLYTKFRYQINERTELMANIFSGQDFFENSIRSVYQGRGPIRRFRLTESYLDRNLWKNSGFSLQWKQEWNLNLSSEITAAVSGHVSQSLVEYSFERIAADVKSDTNSQDILNRVSGFFFYFNNRYRISEKHGLNFGLQASREKAEILITSDNRPDLYRKSEAGIASIYYEYNGEVGALTVNAGMRHNLYGPRATIHHSPRVFMKYDWSESIFTKASWSIYQQFVRQIYHDSPTGRAFSFWVLANENFLPILERQHFMLGGGAYLGKLSVDLEFYDIRSTGELEHAYNLVGFDPITGRPRFDAKPTLYEGLGRTMGMDLYIKWHSESVQPFLSYTLSKSTIAFDEINDGQEILAQNDRRHQLSAGLQYTWKEWNFQSQFHFATGRPYTNLTRFKDDPQDRGAVISLREDRLPNYSRWDVSASYTFDFEKSKLRLKGSVFNLLNRENVKYYQYMYSIEQPEQNENFILGFDQQMLGILPNLELTWIF